MYIGIEYDSHKNLILKAALFDSELPICRFTNNQ